MKAIQFSEFGGPEVLQMAELPDPHPASNQVRIIVHAAGVNPTDFKARQGLHGGDLPQTIGYDVAGVVDEVGGTVSDAKVGDRVFGISDDGAAAAELALLSNYASIPPSLDFAEAAVLSVSTETAARGLDALEVTSETILLINGAAGGIGSSAVQFAIARGARVIGIDSPTRLEYLRALGAEPVAYGEIWSSECGRSSLRESTGHSMSRVMAYWGISSNSLAAPSRSSPLRTFRGLKNTA